MQIRSPAVEGYFYPSDPEVLRSTIDALFTAARKREGPDEGTHAHKRPKALIAPHAGYQYSGQIAAAGYRRAKASICAAKTVLLLGPSHRVAFQGMALPSFESYATALGNMPIANELLTCVDNLPGVSSSDLPHLQEHSLEVHCPFLQYLNPRLRLLPVVVGDAPAAQVATLIDRCIRQPGVFVVASTDLSHFHTYEDATEIDSATSRKIVALNTDLRGNQACGCRVVNGLMAWAMGEGLTVKEVARANSGDFGSDRSRVVGYGSYVIY